MHSHRDLDAPGGSRFRSGARPTGCSKFAPAIAGKSRATGYAEPGSPNHAKSGAANYSKPSAAGRVAHAHSHRYAAAILIGCLGRFDSPESLFARVNRSYCRASRRNKNAPSTIKRTFGNQTSSSGCTSGLPRNVSPMMTKRK